MSSGPVCDSGKDKFERITVERSRGISYFGELERDQDEMGPDLRSIFTKAVTGQEELSESHGLDTCG
ncbi:MAG: hypothetical protein GY866_33715 [Proteobacteria bacterium]|nr:hypothetical protein [Pseudomonadota bacterium]